MTPTSPVQTGAHFDIHGLVSVEVAPGTPGAPQLVDMLRPFHTGFPGIDPFRILVTGEAVVLENPSHAEDAYRYTDDTLFLPRDRVTVTVTDSGFTVAGRGELLTAVIPLLDRLCVLNDAAMVHAAIVNYRGSGVLMPAWGGVGKTSTVAKLVKIDGVQFMADDWAFLRADGTVLGYAKPMFIKAHHQPIYPQLFEGPRKPLVPKGLTKPLERASTIVHPVIVRYPRTAAFTRHWSPEHRMVQPEQAFGAGNIATEAPTRVAMFLERHSGADAVLEPRSAEWMTTRIVGNFHTELPGVSRSLIEALGATGLVPLESYFADKARIVRRGLGSIPCHVLKIPAAWSADRTSDHVTATVQALLNEWA
ncbi:MULTISPECIES: hypothetical protein [unclassified Arthrobacter]|uniref:hypothetical protein n=1 Tax=unclassified Arthrobacter TaxID=235627 RepID=UPI00159CF592|nr:MULTISPECIES: hypothetical protein [unclassified Arthrobacter]MCQ9163353.1 hypothetical protein [Arthrobacter sp. STN4]NVM99923.1 hypothetical protein [Arthrobacter sp. SDTb3-6]